MSRGHGNYPYGGAPRRLTRDEESGIREALEKVEDCCEREGLLTPWEREFIQSIGEWLADERTLTARQAAMLDKIHEKVIR